jgi:hypothetical protein
MWSGHGIIHRYNACDIVLPIFQNGHMCRIDATLKIVSSFKERHHEDKVNFVSRPLLAIGSFLIHAIRGFKVMLQR